MAGPSPSHAQHGHSASEDAFHESGAITWHETAQPGQLAPAHPGQTRSLGGALDPEGIAWREGGAVDDTRTASARSPQALHETGAITWHDGTADVAPKGKYHAQVLAAALAAKAGPDGAALHKSGTITWNDGGAPHGGVPPGGMQQGGGVPQGGKYDAQIKAAADAAAGVPIHESGAITWHDENPEGPTTTTTAIGVNRSSKEVTQNFSTLRSSEGEGEEVSEALSAIPPSEMRDIYKEATAFEGAAVVTMIEREDEDDPENKETALEILMEDGVTLTVELDSGEKRLLDLGYAQELRRVLSFYPVFCFAISTITVFAGVVPMYTQGFFNGGPAALVWYWWICAFFVHLVGLSFAEIASSLPLAGSIYFWAAALSPPHWAPVISFFTGWLEFLGPATGLASVAMNGAVVLQTLISMCTGHILSQPQLYGVSSGIVVISAALNLLPIGHQSLIFVFSGTFQLLGGIVIIILLPVLAVTLQPASFVFGEYYGNTLTNTPSAGYSFLLALQVPQFSLYGYDGVCHLAEETKRSDLVAPRTIMLSIFTISIVGWLLIVSATFSIQSIDDLLNGSLDASGYAYLQIVWDVFRARYNNDLGAQIITGVIFSSFFFGCMVGIVAAVRVCFSLARDNGFPFSRVFRTVHPTTKVPVYAVFLICGLGLLFLLPVLGSNAIFLGITSAQSIAWVGAYGVPIFFRMVMEEKEFCPGPFYMADYIGVTGGKIVHGLALVYVLFMVVNFSLPTAFPVKHDNFNYAIVGLIAFLTILTVWWVVDAQYWFVGPRKAAHDVDGTPMDVGESVEFYDGQKGQEM